MKIRSKSKGTNLLIIQDLLGLRLATVNYNKENIEEQAYLALFPFLKVNNSTSSHASS